MKTTMIEHARYKLNRTQLDRKVYKSIVELNKEGARVGLLQANKNGFFEVLITPHDSQEATRNLESILQQNHADIPYRFVCSAKKDGTAVRLRIMHEDLNELSEAREHLRRTLLESL